MTSEVLALAKELINRKSVTPEDAGCQQMMSDYLQPLGFAVENLDFADTQNIWARKGNDGPLFCFAGHTDVVPSGPEKNWLTSPFVATEIDGYLHGRGAADMKGSLAAILVATKNFIKDFPEHKGTIAF